MLNMNLKNNALSIRSQAQKITQFYGPIYMNFPEYANSETVIRLVFIRVICEGLNTKGDVL